MSQKQRGHNPRWKPNSGPKTNADPKTSRAIPEIQHSPAYMKLLESFVISQEDLEHYGYVLKQLSAEKLDRKKKCVKCTKYLMRPKNERSTGKKNNAEDMKSFNGKTLNDKNPPDPADLASLGSPDKNSDSFIETSTPTKGSKPVDSKTDRPDEMSPNSPKTKTIHEKVLRCKFHNGVCRQQFWSCCNQHKWSKGCTASENHTAQHYSDRELENIWKYFTTPEPTLGSIRRAAVAIDCEMGGNKYGESELIRISAIDYFTSEILINHLVYPDEPIDDYRTRFSGVSRNQMEEARRNRQCIFGIKAAREALWQFVGPNTIIVGHSANNDLTALRWIHYRIVDTLIVEEIKRKNEDKEAEKALLNMGSSIPAISQNPSNFRQSLSLKKMIKSRCGRDIQVGRAGHDSLEDAIAARDLSHWNVMKKGQGRIM